MGYHGSKGSQVSFTEGGCLLAFWPLEESASHHFLARAPRHPHRYYSSAVQRLALRVICSGTCRVFNIVRQHGPMGPKTSIWARLRPPNAKICQKITIRIKKTNSVGSIARHQVNLRTCRAQNLNAHTFIYYLIARELIPTEGSRAEIDQRWPTHN